MKRCPACESDQITTHETCEHLAYGVAPNHVTLVYVMPYELCASCGLMFTSEAGEVAQANAIKTYRARLYGASPEIKPWVAENAHMLEALGPVDIITAWEEYRKRAVLG